MRETGGLRKPNMDSDSRKAQRNSFAHHRAERLVASPEMIADDLVAWLARPTGPEAVTGELFFGWLLPAPGSCPAAAATL